MGSSLSTALSSNVNETKPEHQKTERTGLAFSRHFTARQEAGKTPYDEIRWELRNATIANDKGAIMFEQRDVEVPSDW